MDEYKELLQTTASIIQNVEELSDLDICKIYDESSDEQVKNACIAQLAINHWEKINKYYYISRSLHLQKEDVLSWLFSAIWRALKDKAWENEESNLYNNENAFNIIINRIMFTTRATVYQASNRKKRKDGHKDVSLNGLTELCQDHSIIAEDMSSQDDYFYTDMNIVISLFFKKKEYFNSFLLDAIVYHKLTDDKKLKSFLLNVKRNSEEFASRYGFPIEEVEKACDYVERIGYANIDRQYKKHRQELMRFLSK